MASSENYLQYVLEQLSSIDEITYRAMMGEYILYYRGKIVGGIYDDRLLVKRMPAAERLMPNAPLAIPYEGAKEMLLVEDIEDRDLLIALVSALYDELPAPKKRSR